MTRTKPINAAQVNVRAATARKYLEVGELVMGVDPAERQVAAGLAVLAAVAAADAICGKALGVHASPRWTLACGDGPAHDLLVGAARKSA